MHKILVLMNAHVEKSFFRPVSSQRKRQASVVFSVASEGELDMFFFMK